MEHSIKDPRVLDAMLPYLTSYYGNPHSRTHAYGWESEAAVEKAREQVAILIGIPIIHLQPIFILNKD